MQSRRLSLVTSQRYMRDNEGEPEGTQINNLFISKGNILKVQKKSTLRHFHSYFQFENREKVINFSPDF